MNNKTHEFSQRQKQQLKYAKKISYISLTYSFSIILLMYFVMGHSQAMKTAWIEDILSLFPAMIFLFTNRFNDVAPTEKYPYGFHRIGSLGYLFSALALLVLGSSLFISALIKLITKDYPTIGMLNVFGIDLWQGWWMLLVLIWGVIPPLVLGHLKLKPAQILNDKNLYVDAQMNKADWMTAAATAIGILGIGLGFWWADAVAAMVISLDIIKDGLTQTKNSSTELMNRSPKNLEGEFIDLPQKTLNYLMSLSWIAKAQVRMYELGHVIYIEAFVVPKPTYQFNLDTLEKTREQILKIHERAFDVSLTLLREEKLM